MGALRPGAIWTHVGELTSDATQPGPGGDSVEEPVVEVILDDPVERWFDVVHGEEDHPGEYQVPGDVVKVVNDQKTHSDPSVYPEHQTRATRASPLLSPLLLP